LEWTALTGIVDLERTIDDFVFLCLLFGNKATPSKNEIAFMLDALF